MRIGVPKEIKDEENRVGMAPAGVRELVAGGHEVLVEKGAGIGSGFPDDDYRKAGAQLVSVGETWDAGLVVKIKEPLEKEFRFLKDQIVFTYFHLAGVPKSLTEELLKKKTTAIAYETVEDEKGKLPLLAPMSAVAGNMAVVMGSYYLAKFNNGRGMQLGSVLGKSHGKVVVIGDGVVGHHAAHTAAAMGAHVVMFTRHPEKAAQLKREISDKIEVAHSAPETISSHLKDADLVVGGVLLHGAKAPWVVTREMVKAMQPGAVIVDVSIDQGGCIETSRPTSHSEPVFTEHGVIHYCVTNMPGAYPRTSTVALTSATLPYVKRLVERGLDAVKEDEGFLKGLNTCRGFLTYRPVAEALGMGQRYKDAREALS